MTLSTADRFEALAQLAETAGRRGNYAIAACFVVRSAGREIAFFGENTLFSAQDPSGHAELNALRLAGRFAHQGTAPDEAVEVRAAPDEPDESTLFATLEPCPMCTVAAINSQPDRIVVAIEDPPSGALHPTRLAALPPMWVALAKSIDVVFCQQDRADEPLTYLPPPLMNRLNDVFVDSRTRLDHLLAERGVIHRDAIERYGRP